MIEFCDLLLLLGTLGGGRVVGFTIGGGGGFGG